MVDLLYSDLTYKVRGAAFETYNTLGFGHKELVYQRALAQELTTRNVNYQREPKLNVQYKGEKVGLYIPDFLVENKIIIELKSLEFMPPNLMTQLVNYLKGTGYKLGLLINFGTDKIQIYRKIWSPEGSVKISF